MFTLPRVPCLKILHMSAWMFWRAKQILMLHTQNYVNCFAVNCVTCLDHTSLIIYWQNRSVRWPTTTWSCFNWWTLPDIHISCLLSNNLCVRCTSGAVKAHSLLRKRTAWGQAGWCCDHTDMKNHVCTLFNLVSDWGVWIKFFCFDHDQPVVPVSSKCFWFWLPSLSLSTANTRKRASCHLSQQWWTLLLPR